MESKGIRELRSDLAGFVRRAQAGERIIVSVSGQPVASLGPLTTIDSSPHISDLVASGRVIAPRRRGDYLLRPMVSIWTGTRIERVVRELRG